MVLIGIFIVIVAFVVGSVVGYEALFKLGNFGAQNFIIAPMQTIYMQINVTNTSSLVIVTYRASANLNFYFANESGFQQLHHYLNGSTNLTNEAGKLYGSGVLLSYINSPIGSFPYYAQSQSSPPPAFYVKNITTLIQGNYYLLFANPSGSVANVTVVSDVTSTSKSSIISLSITGIGIFLIFVFGLVVITYGIIKKPSEKPVEKAAVTKEEVDKLYANIEGGEKKPTRRKKGRKTKSAS